jgi:hypothetical protein
LRGDRAIGNVLALGRAATNHLTHFH